MAGQTRNIHGTPFAPGEEFSGISDLLDVPGIYMDDAGAFQADRPA